MLFLNLHHSENSGGKGFLNGLRTAYLELLRNITNRLVMGGGIQTKELSLGQCYNY